MPYTLEELEAEKALRTQQPQYTLEELEAEKARRQAPAPKRERTFLGKTVSGIGDVGVTALKGAIGLTEIPVGIADIATGGRVGKALESIGYRPKEAKDILGTMYTPEQQEAFRAVREAKGFVTTVVEAIKRPSTIGHAIVESAPAMAAGGLVGRGILAAAPKVAPYIAGAIGEGVVGAGSAAEQVRQQTPEGTLGMKQAGAIIGSGIGTSLFGALGGKLAGTQLAKKLGIIEVDTYLATGGAMNAASKANILKRLASGGITEGFFEELPQSAQEQVWQNVALDRPLMEGVPEAAGMGLVTGAAMGGVASAALKGGTPPIIPDEQITEQPPVEPVQPTGALARAAALLDDLGVKAEPLTPEIMPALPPAPERKALGRGAIPLGGERKPIVTPVPMVQDGVRIRPDERFFAPETGLEPPMPTVAEELPKAIGERRSDDGLRRHVQDLMDKEDTEGAYLLMYEDPLTGLLNPAAWKKVEPEAQEQNKIFASMDVSGLGWINDTFGHSAEDILLKTISSEIKKAGIKGYRKGGDEIAGIFDNQAEADILLRKAQDAIANKTIEVETPDGKKYAYTGWRLDYGTGQSFDKADATLYKGREEQVKAGLRGTTKGAKPHGVVEAVPKRIEIDAQGKVNLLLPTDIVTKSGTPYPSEENAVRAGKLAKLSDKGYSLTPVEGGFVWRKTEQVAEAGKPIEITRRAVEAEKGKEPWEMTAKEFNEAADKGRLHQATDKILPGEKEAKSPLRMGEINKYTPEDIAHFYANSRGAYEKGNKYIQEQIAKGYNPYNEGRKELIQDALSEGKPVPASVLKDYPDLQKAKPVTPPDGKVEVAKPAISKVEKIPVVKSVLQLRPSHRTTLEAVKSEISQGEAGERIPTTDAEGNVTGMAGRKSTFPDYFRDKGYTKAEAINAIDKALSGQELTINQRLLVENLNQGYREKAARGLAKGRATQEVDADILEVGDSFKRHGEQFVVEDVNEDGKVKLKDGVTFYLQGDESLKYDRGTLKRAEVTKEEPVPVSPAEKKAELERQTKKDIENKIITRFVDEINSQSKDLIGKKPWEMTESQWEAIIKPVFDAYEVKQSMSFPIAETVRQTFLDRYGYDQNGNDFKKGNISNARHEVQVAHALRNGKPVPENILKDYPKEYWKTTSDLMDIAKLPIYEVKEAPPVPVKGKDQEMFAGVSKAPLEKGLKTEKAQAEDLLAGFRKPEEDKQAGLFEKKAEAPKVKAKAPTLETINLDAIPEGLTLEVKAIRGKTGKEVTIKEDAKTAIKESQSTIDKYEALLECLKT